MDLLSRILSGVRVRSPLLSDMRVSQDIAVDLLEGAGAPCYFVVDGKISVAIGPDIHHLEAGDFALLPTWPRHIMRFGAGSEPRSIIEIVTERELPMWSMEDGLDTPLFIEIGPAPHKARVLSGICAFDREEATFLTASLPKIITLRPRGRKGHPSIEAAFELLLRELDDNFPGFAAVAARSLELLFVQALRSWFLQTEHEPGWARGLGQINVRRALLAMHTEPGRQWTLNELARVAGQSRSAFADTFRDIMGEAPLTHLRRLRMHLASARLRGTRQSIANIASEFGYASSYSFARAFQQHAGMTASAYRRSSKKMVVAD